MSLSKIKIPWLVGVGVLLFGISLRSLQNDTLKIEPKKPETLTITYIANEGILIATPSNKVLIDALFTHPNPEYEAPSEEIRQNMEKGLAPFQGIDLILVTHNHPDHFDPGYADRFLANTSQIKMIAPQDAVDALKEKSTRWEAIQDRVISIQLKPGEQTQKELNGIHLQCFRTLHSGDSESPQNLMYLINLEGWTIFHEGDSDGKIKTYREFGLENTEIDLALVHFWFPLHETGATILQEILKAKHVGLIHLPVRLKNDAPSKIELVRQTYPDIFLFLSPMEQKTFFRK